METLSRLVAITVILGTLFGCASAAPTPSPRPDGAAPPPSAPRADQSRTMVLAGRVEPATLSSKVLQTTGGSAIGATSRVFNAFLTILDDRGISQPYLAQAVPQLNTDTWRVFPDGKMETIYRLKPNLAWHDGQPLTANDFIFAWQVYRAPEMGEPNGAPYGLMEEVTAPDPQTLVIRWKSTYRDANRLNEDFPPLPRHLLEPPFQSQIATFTNLPFWTNEYIGAGPFRLERWDIGSFIDATSFERHVLGQPPISRIRVLFIPDANAALAQLLAGEAHATVDDVIRFQQAAILRREWDPRNGGTILSIPDQWRRSEIQHRPEYANPKAILDPRVRKALAHGVDRQALVDVLFEGEGIIADSPIPPSVDYFAAIKPQLASYGYEPRRTEQLMAEAGFTKGADGIYTSPAEGRPTWELKVNVGTQAETEMAIMAAGWRQLGFDVREATLPAAQSRDGQIRGTFPTFFTGGGTVGDDVLPNFTSERIPNAENRWVGNNRGGWSNPDYDRLVDSFNVALDRSERARVVAQMLRIFSEDVAAISLFFNPGMVAYTSALEGPRLSAPDPQRTWNIHEWRWKG